MKTAKTLGSSVPLSLQASADEVMMMHRSCQPNATTPEAALENGRHQRAQDDAKRKFAAMQKAAIGRVIGP